MSATSKVERLEAMLNAFDSVLVAFSGGVDSAYLLRVAVDQLGDRAIALTTVSPSTPRPDEETASRLAVSVGVEQLVIDSRELDDPNYVANPTNRCFFCKSELYSIAAAKASELAVDVVIDGTNHDDLSDHRPGMQAAQKWGVRSPLAEVGLTKAEIRKLSFELGLETWDRPASPCLASRIPYGTTVSAEKLGQIGAAEAALRELGFREFRVRYHGELARLEISKDEMQRAFQPAIREALVTGVREAGFMRVTIDPAGYRRGSLNILG